MTTHRQFFVIVTAALLGCTVNLGSDAGSDGTDSSSGDGDGDSSGDGDGDTQSCPEGTQDCPCYGNNSCNAGLECIDGTCSPTGDGDGDGDTGDGDGDTGDGDGDTGDGDGDTGDGDGDGDTGDGDGDGDLCGNGDIDLGEACDDANLENGDGCNNDCTDSGALLWQDSFPVFNDIDVANGVAVDSNDRIFVSGYGRVANNNMDGWYRKYSPDGQLFWDDTFGGPGTEGCTRIDVNSDDEILVVGWLYNSMNVNTDAMLRKLDQNGAEIWTRQWEIIADDTAFGVAVAADGTIAVSGGSAGQTGWLRRFDAGGMEIWTRTFMNIGARSRDVGHTADGHIAVVIDTGHYARLYTTAGNVVWDYAGQNTCELVALAVDGNDVLMAGCQTTNPNNGYFGRLDPDGNLLWDETWIGDGNGYAYANDIAVDSAGRIIVVGNRRIVNQAIVVSTRKYSPDGQTLIWEQTLQGSKVDGFNTANAVTIDSQDNVIVVGNVEEDTGQDAFVAKYGP